MSIIYRYYSAIHWGLGERAHDWGGVSIAFRYWNLVSTRFISPVRGRVKGKAWRPIRYPPWQKVGLFSSLARSEK